MKRTLLHLALTAALTAVAAASGPVSIKVSPEQDYLLRSGNGDIVFKIDLLAAAQKVSRTSPLNVAVVLDRSGSMRGAKLEKAKQAAQLLIERLGHDDIFSLVTYDDEVDVIIPAGKIDDADRLIKKVDRIRSGGSTALHAGVKAGAAQLREFMRRKGVNRVILLSDGLANIGPDTPDDLARLGRQLREDGLHVSTIGLGDDYNEDLMVALAEASAANYYYVQDAEKLPGIFAEELGNLQSIVARGLKIIIQLPEGVEGLEVVGHPEIEFRGHRAELTVGEIYGRQRCSYLVKARVRNLDGERVDLGQVQLNYRDALADEDRAADAQIFVKLTGDRQQAAQSVNTGVREGRALAETMAAKDAAFNDADQGKVKEAVATLRSRIAANEAAAPASAPVRKLNAELDARAAELEREGRLDKSSRKAFQYEVYEQKKQRSN